MALVFEQHGAGYANGAEDSPSVHESDLTGGDGTLVRTQNRVVVKNVAMHKRQF
jgi:hypothetical protein